MFPNNNFGTVDNAYFTIKILHGVISLINTELAEKNLLSNINDIINVLLLVENSLSEFTENEKAIIEITNSYNFNIDTYIMQIKSLSTVIKNNLDIKAINSKFQNQIIQSLSFLEDNLFNCIEILEQVLDAIDK